MFIQLSVVSKSRAAKISHQCMPLVMRLEVPDAQIRGHLAEVASHLTSRLRKLDHVSKVQQQSQDSSHPDDHFQSRYVSPGLKTIFLFTFQ